MKKEPLSPALAALLVLALSAPVSAQGQGQPAPLSPAWQGSLDRYLQAVRQLDTSWKRPDVDARNDAMRRFLTPMVRQVDASGRPVQERTQIITADGPSWQERSTAGPDGRHSFLESSAFGLTAPMGIELTGQNPVQRMLGRYQQRMQDTRLDLTGTFRDVHGQVHGELAPAVIQTMKEYPDPNGNLRDLQPWHQFFHQADQYYLPGLDRNYGVQLAPEDLKSLDPARRRHQQVDARLRAAGAWNPQTWSYDMTRLVAEPAPGSTQPIRREERAVPSRDSTPPPRQANPPPKQQQGGGVFDGIFGF